LSLSHYKVRRMIKSIDNRLKLRKSVTLIISEMIDDYLKLIVSILKNTMGKRVIAKESDIKIVREFIEGIFSKTRGHLKFLEKIANGELDVNKWVSDFATEIIDGLESVICETVGIDTETICNAVITLVLEIMKQLKSELGDID